MVYFQAMLNLPLPPLRRVMKNLSKTFLACTLLISISSFAEETTYNCGREYGYKVVLKISQTEETAQNALTATFQAPAIDRTTGTLIRSKNMNFSGSIETIGDTKAYHLQNTADPRHHIFAQIKRPRAKAEVSEIRFGAGDSTREVNRVCRVAKASN
jgi:hypothetical protein